ncbi:MAG: cysteine desulfurase [Nitrososphaerota archaeon]|nr:cysteine desulfurase [Candidatus Calditenuaceae archaeon]MDW8073070.1 cysteine desulfurase [Nitrososphaerota archaeon]
MSQAAAAKSPYRIRKDFPIFSRIRDSKPLVYLDNAATTQKPLQVIQAIADFYSMVNANVHRGVYSLSIESTEKYERVRRLVAGFIDSESWREVIFTRNATEAINLVAYAYALHRIKRGGKIVITEMEHHSNIVPWQLVAQMRGLKIEALPITEEGYLDLSQLDRILRDADLLAVVHASNVLGTINPVKHLVEAAKSWGAAVLVDAAQSVPHMPVSFRELGCDFLAFSGHKMLGPMGVGCLVAKEEMLEPMEPFMGGGEMISEVTLSGSRWNEVPWKFEAGTPSVADVVGLGAAVEYLNSLGLEWVRRHEEELTEAALQELSEIPQSRVIGPESVKDRCGLISFTLADIHPHDLAEYLDRYFNIAVRAGHHCAMPLHSRLGLTATTRASFYIYNTKEEVQLLADALRSALKYFKA